MTSDLPLRLTIELVPQTCQYASLRTVISPGAWDRLQRRVLAQSSQVCGICGAEGPLLCQEHWRYDEVFYVQHLDGFIALCIWCHHVKHLLQAGILAHEGKLDFERVVQHFMRVNQCYRADFEAHGAAAFATWRQRSAHPWHTDLGEYAWLVAAGR
jgi:hypothetical protein